MAGLRAGDRVEHVNDSSLGVGIVDYVKDVADVRTAYVVWGGTTRVERYTEAQLRVVEDLAGRLASAVSSSQVSCFLSSHAALL